MTAAPSPALTGLADSAELFARWQNDRDQRAREQLVERFMPLARKLAGRYRGRGREPYDDLLQVASFALLKAIDRFDPGRELTFTSFAVPTIVGELKRHFRDTGWSVHVPRGAKELAQRVQAAERAVSARTGRSPTAHELAEFMELSVEEVLDGLQAAAAHHSASLDAPHNESDGGTSTLAETLGEKDARFENVDDIAAIESALAYLDRRERELIQLRFGAGLTQTQIAARMGVSQMQVSRLLGAVLDRLRDLTR